MSNQTPLADLILNRMKELGLDHETLGHLLGISNPAKAAGRVYAMCDENTSLSRKSRSAINRLPDLLNVPPEVVTHAVAETDRIFAEGVRRSEDELKAVREREDATWRAAFVPHAIIQTSLTVPTQISICGMTGGTGRWLTIRLDADRPPLTFVEQALAALPEKTRLGPTGRRGVMFFGEALGFIINYTPDRAVRFDLEGTPLEILSKAYRPGEVVLSFGGPPVAPAVVANVLGFM